jgi:DNA repair protein RecN (Recombination protein N)
MLTTLSIRNIVLIEALDLDFSAGLGVLTGETGAGKSILLDALGLVLGARADLGLIRAGESVASVTASFEPEALASVVADTLGDAGVEIEPGEPLILRRQLKADGGSKAYINDRPVSVALLRDIAPFLVEIHGQHDDRGLVNPRGHRALLDRYVGRAAGVDAGAVASAWHRWRGSEDALGTRARVCSRRRRIAICCWPMWRN